MNIRKADINDLPDLKQLYYDTISEVCKRDYDQVQIAIWRSSVSNVERWDSLLEQQFFIVGEEKGKIIGFASLDMDYIDMLFVHKDHQSKGVAKNLYQKIEREAKKNNQKKLMAYVSKTAKVFFEKQGFNDCKEQEVILHNIKFVNYRMSKILI